MCIARTQTETGGPATVANNVGCKGSLTGKWGAVIYKIDNLDYYFTICQTELVDNKWGMWQCLQSRDWLPLKKQMEL